MPMQISIIPNALLIPERFLGSLLSIIPPYCLSYKLTSAQTSESCTAEEKKSKKKRAPLRLYDRHLQARLLNEAERASIEYVRTIRTRQYNGTFCFGYGVSGKVCKFYRSSPITQTLQTFSPVCIL